MKTIQTLRLAGWMLITLLAGNAIYRSAESAQTPVTLAPRYECSGEIGHERYQTTLTVETRGDHYLLDWSSGAVIGIGVLDGDRLAVAFIQRSNSAVGVVMYRVLPGQLLGRWAVGDGMIYREDCLVGQPAAQQS